MSNLSLQATTKIITRLLKVSADDLDNGFRPATQEQLPEILAIRQTIGVGAPIDEDEKYLQWRYSFSPNEVPDQPLKRNSLWVLILHHKVIGFLGTEATKLRIDDTVVDSLKVMDIAVIKEHDGKGLGVWMTLKLQEYDPPMIVLGSNDNSAGIVRRLFHFMPARKLYKNILHETDYFFKVVRNKLAANFLSFFYRVYLKSVLGIKILIAGSSLKLQGMERFESGLDEIASPKKVAVVRNAAYVNWQLSNPREDNEIKGIWVKDKLIGYIVYSTTLKNLKKSALVMDWGFFKKEYYARYLHVVFMVLQIKLLDERYSTIEVLCYDQDSESALSKAGLFLRDSTTKTLAVFCSDSGLSEILYNADNWFLSGGDGDDF